MKQKRIPNKLFLLSLLVPILVLSSMLVKPLNTMNNGESVTLATIPIDPVDLFYGQYVNLHFEIQEVDVSLLVESFRKKVEDNKYSKDIPVYVSLAKGEDSIYKATKVSKEKPNSLYIKGKMSPYINDNSWNEDSKVKESVSINYGIDRFYVEEGKGAELEKQAQVGQVLVSAKIHDGYPVLTDIKGVK